MRITHNSNQQNIKKYLIKMRITYTNLFFFAFFGYENFRNLIFGPIIFGINSGSFHNQKKQKNMNHGSPLFPTIY